MSSTAISSKANAQSIQSTSYEQNNQDVLNAQNLISKHKFFPQEYRKEGLKGTVQVLYTFGGRLKGISGEILSINGIPMDNGPATPVMRKNTSTYFAHHKNETNSKLFLIVDAITNDVADDSVVNKFKSNNLHQVLTTYTFDPSNEKHTKISFTEYKGDNIAQEDEIEEEEKLIPQEVKNNMKSIIDNIKRNAYYNGNINGAERIELDFDSEGSFVAWKPVIVKDKIIDNSTKEILKHAFDDVGYPTSSPDTNYKVFLDISYSSTEDEKIIRPDNQYSKEDVKNSIKKQLQSLNPQNKVFDPHKNNIDF